MIADQYADLASVAGQNAQRYASADPFPHIVFDDFIDPAVLEQVLAEFPDLSRQNNVQKFSGPSERKLAGKGEAQFGQQTRALMHFLNSEPFLHFLQQLTGIEEVLLPDPYFAGGGLHEIKTGGMLKMHADFNKHPTLDLDRRINVLVYLNKDWASEWGGELQLWDRSMERCVQAIEPVFNRMVVFSTNSDSWHGHPDALKCPEDRSRKSLALYYFSLGRPASEVANIHGTVFRARPGAEGTGWRFKNRATSLAVDCIPPIVLKGLRRLRDGR